MAFWEVVKFVGLLVQLIALIVSAIVGFTAADPAVARVSMAYMFGITFGMAPYMIKTEGDQ